MARKTLITLLQATVCAGGMLAIGVGCQSSIGGQTLPSANYLRDDTQFFAPGPETPLANQRRELELYRANQKDAQGGLLDRNAPPAPGN